MKTQENNEKKKTRLEGIQFLKEESTLGVIHIYTAFPKGHFQVCME